MPVPREMLATAVALQGMKAPGEFINLAQSTLVSMLGLSESDYVITRINVEEGAQAGVASVELMITRREQVTINQQELQASESRVLALMQREDINTLEFIIIDQARQTVDFIAAGLPAYGLKTYWIYPGGLQGEGQSQSSTDSSTGQEQRAVSQPPSIAMW